MAKLTYADIIERDQRYRALAELGLRLELAELPQLMPRLVALVAPEHLPLLASAPGGIQKLRGLILELAVRGKLVPQDPSDEPASELLKRIAAEKARLVAEGRIKKQKPLTEISEEEKPFELPAGWEWVRLVGLLKKIGAGSTPLGG